MFKLRSLVRPSLNLIKGSSQIKITSQAGSLFSSSLRLPFESRSNVFHKMNYCTTATKEDNEEVKTESDLHTIITDKERGRGKAVKQDFQAETKQLLEIVAKSLYSEKEVFIRELIANSNDALEKLRYMQTTGKSVIETEKLLEIHLKTDDIKRTFTVQDTGVGMTKDDMINNLGTIARSGSKEFLKDMDAGDIKSSIIGQFGVGFYASFMVADKVEVFSKSCSATSEDEGFKWVSDGLGSYEICEAEGVTRGTKIVLHLKKDAYEFSKEDIIKDIIKKYSNFVGAPIYLNGKRVNAVEPLWLKDPSQVTPEEHDEFYRYIANAFDSPRYVLSYKTDSPIDIRALLYIPMMKPSLFDISRETEVGVALYSRKVMIQSYAKSILPKWLRFMRGVVDSEDIPLNLSRELLQDSALIRKINRTITTKVIRFLLEQAKKDPVQYMDFYKNFGLFIKEGIVITPEQDLREDIAKLLRFESSGLPEGERTSLNEYAQRMKAGARTIHFLAAPTRELALTSPYYEALKQKDENIEVLFLYEPYDELVLMQLNQFDRKNLRSLENDFTDDASNTDTVDTNNEDSLAQDDADSLMNWVQEQLGKKVKKVKVTKRLTNHPCVVSIKELGAVRHFLRTTMADKSEDERFALMEPVLEMNPTHPIVRKLNTLRETKPELARLVTLQLFDNALTQAGLMEDPRLMVNRINDLLTKTMEEL